MLTAAIILGLISIVILDMGLQQHFNGFFDVDDTIRLVLALVVIAVLATILSS